MPIGWFLAQVGGRFSNELVAALVAITGLVLIGLSAVALLFGMGATRRRPARDEEGLDLLEPESEGHRAPEDVI